MTSRHPAIGYLQRLFQILRIVFHELAILARRRMRGSPTLGHELLRDALEQIGGCFVKLGQVMSLQIDILPLEYCNALLSLLDRVPTASTAEISGVFIEEFGCAPQALYSEFDPTAMASASIGQVHRARLQDGTLVAVKVQRPGVRSAFQRDIQLMGTFVWLIFLLRIRSLYFVRDLVGELSSWTNDELDYRREASHCDIIGANAVGSLTERIPRVFWNLTRPRVLTMEYLEGPTVMDYLRRPDLQSPEPYAGRETAGFDSWIFCSNVISNFLRDAFRYGVFHADLHPANLLVLPNNVVGYVDFGIVAKLTPEARHKQIELTLAYSSGDPEEIYRQFLNICVVTPDADLEGMRRRIAEIAHTWYEEPAVHGKVRFKTSITITMRDLLIVARTYGVLVDREMIKYIRSTVLVDGVVSRLAPGFDIAEVLRNVVEEYLFEQSRSKVFSPGGAISVLADLAIWMKTGPTSMVRALELFERRQISQKTRAARDGPDENPLRVRTFAGIAVWAIIIVFLALGGGSTTMRSSPFWGILIGVFVSLWTVWLLFLVRRLLRRL